MSVEKDKKIIDTMSQEEMCRLWRFAPPGHSYFIGEIGDYFIEKMNEKGRMTSEISKKLGWEK